MFAYYQKEWPDENLSTIYDALSKDLEEIIDSNFFNTDTTRVLKNIRDTWDIWKKRIIQQSREKVDNGQVIQRKARFQMSATKYQKGVATVVDTEIDKWAEEAINGEVSISKRPHKNEEAVASEKINTSADDIQRQTRHGRNIPNYRESDEPEYVPKRIKRESNAHYSKVTESQPSATLYLTPPMTEVAESSSSNSDLGSLDRSKATIGEQMYEKVISMLQMGNKLAIDDSIVNKLNNIFSNIFQSSYSEIEAKIISETMTDDNQTSDEDRFIFFVRYALLEFVSKFKFMMPKVLDRDMLERSYIIEVLSPILLAFRKAFPDVKYMWVEKDVRLSDARELLNVEVSGPPYRSMKKHTVGDVKKLLIMAICSLCRLLGNNLNCNIEDAKNVKTYSIQVIGDRLTLFSVSLADKRKYLAVELASCIIPFAFDAITCYMRIFNFFAVIRNEFVEQENLQKKIRSFIPGNNCSEDLREWLHLPDNDISLVTEEDMDEIFL
ncbi:hypothetical protein C1646_743887 [Rhizophagus diaphanus]|nr:hypothetical protein C1646_743887 [Rhizophagus diaphanus] [Rhizophagus sp. MUCL 43196]